MGEPIPPEFARLVRRLEQILRIPLWLMVQNGDENYCCTNICPHALEAFQQDCDGIPRDGAGILIHSCGGDAHIAYTIARLFQRRTNNFAVIVPRIAKSAATLLALGASRLILGIDAELGPLDVQMEDMSREDIGSALDAVQSLEQLNTFTISAVDEMMFSLSRRTKKRTDILLPIVFNYATNFVRPLLEKIDTVDYTKKSRELKVAREYALRLMRRKYEPEEAIQIAAKLVEEFPTHGFVIDREESGTAPNQGNRRPRQLLDDYGLGLRLERTSEEMEKIFRAMKPFLDSLSVIGKLVEVDQ
jgi:hypothetical protein